jgi:hypothetical protein
MKNLLLKAMIITVAVFYSTATLFANHNDGVYRLRVGKNFPFTLSVNGDATRELRNEYVLNLPAGVHRIKVRIPPPASAPWMPYRTVYKGKIVVKPNTETVAFIDMANNLRIFQERSLMPAPPPPPSPAQHGGHGHHNNNSHHQHNNSHNNNNYNPYSDDNGYNNSNNNSNPYTNNNNNPYNNNDTPYTNNNNSNPYNNNDTYQPPRTAPTTPNTAPSATAMSADKFQALKDLLRDKAFDNDRIAIAQQAIAQTPISCEQLRQLIATLSFEQSRVDLAKYARKYVIDPQNFQVIYSEFKFSNSIQELSKL